MTDSFLDFGEISPNVYEKPFDGRNRNPVDETQIFTTEKSFPDSANSNSINPDNNILKNSDPFLRSSDNSHPIFDPPFNDLDTARRKKTTSKPPNPKSSCYSNNSSLSLVLVMVIFSVRTGSPFWR